MFAAISAKFFHLKKPDTAFLRLCHNEPRQAYPTTSHYKIKGNGPVSVKTNYGSITLDSTRSKSLSKNVPIFSEIYDSIKTRKDKNVEKVIVRDSQQEFSFEEHEKITHRVSKNSVYETKQNSKCFLFASNCWKTRPEIHKLCRSSIIQNDENVLVINKPHGIPVTLDQNYPHDLRSTLLSMGGELEIPDPSSFHAIGRPDIRTTGIVIFAKTGDVGRLLRSHYTDGRVNKSYKAVVVGCPSTPRGDINVPVGHFKCSDNRFKVSIPSTAFLKHVDFKKQVHDKKAAVTSYQVEKHSPYSNCSLVSCTTRNGRKHQLRVHLSYFLGTPVLGDHRYSSIMGRVPQRLSMATAECLGIRNSQGRHLPMLLHCHSVVLPSLSGDGTTTYSAEIPDFYSDTCKRLGL